MSISMSSASLPVFITMLSNLNHFLDKAQSFVDPKKCDPGALTQYRLAPDMLTHLHAAGVDRLRRCKKCPGPHLGESGAEV